MNKCLYIIINLFPSNRGVRTRDILEYATLGKLLLRYELLKTDRKKYINENDEQLKL